jgi:tetratricopeptide (TPR) repeat protein
MHHAETLKLLTRLPERRPASSLPSRLDEFFDRLMACATPGEARPVEEAIWGAWMHHGHEEAELALERASADMAARRFDLAETRLAILLRRRPDWAEAWNKRATLCYLMERDDESVEAIHRTLELEPRHFGALCGLGEIFRSRGDAGAALLAFGLALRVHPQLDEVRETIRALRANRADSAR